MNKSEWQVLGLTALVLIIVTASAVYVNQTDPQIRERNQLQQVRQILNTPSSAEYLGKHTYNISNEMNIVYTWKDQTTLYEAQITPEGTIKTYIYTLQSDELNATMSPLLAQTFSERLFIGRNRDPSRLLRGNRTNIHLYERTTSTKVDCGGSTGGSN